MNINISNKFIFFTCLILGIYLCIIGGYGSDEDTLPMIGTFVNFLDGNFMTSRFTGYPVSEFIIGFFSYYFGSTAINLIIFISFIIGSALFFICLENKIGLNNIIKFLILILSSPILFFDNLEPVDYSIPFIFLSLGFFSITKKRTELAVIFFGISIGARINFVPFIIALIIFSDKKYFNDQYSKAFLILTSLFAGALFYLPVWIHSGLGFDWLTAGRPEGGLLEYFARFSYKTILTFGFLQSIIIFYLVKKILEKKINSNYKILISIIILNLLIFLYIPAELSYLQPMLVCVYYLAYKILNNKYFYTLLIINFFTWFLTFQVIEIQYKYKNKCDPIVAEKVKFELQLTKGYFFKFLQKRNMISCWIDPNTSYGQKVLRGEALKKK